MFRSFIIIFLLFFLGCAHSVIDQSQTSSERDSSKNVFYRTNCQILDRDFQVIRTMPGNGPCLFLKDGAYVHTILGQLPTADDSKSNKITKSRDAGLYRRDAMGNVLWFIPGYFHHALELDSEGHVVALGSENQSFKNKIVRFDVIYKIDPQGKIISKFSLADHTNDIFKLNPQKNSSPIVSVYDPNAARAISAKFEFSHVNSIYEVPVSARGKFQNAKYLVNEPVAGLCLGLDTDFKKIVWSHRYSGAYSFTHDCQPLADGSFLYYENRGTLFTSDKKPITRIVQIKDGVEAFSFPRSGDTENYFYANACGGIEIVPDGFLFSISYSETRTELVLVSKAGKSIKKWNVPYQVQDMKFLDEPEFLKKNMIR